MPVCSDCDTQQKEGKGGFNVTALNEELTAELTQVTRRGIDAYRAAGYL